MSKIALITGGSRGLGKSMAHHLAARGVDVIITYHSQNEAAEAVVADIQSKGGKAAALHLDVTNHQDFAAFSVQLKDVLSTKFQSHDFDYLINNAGMGAYASIAETSVDSFDLMVNAHLKGPFFLTQTLLPLIKDGGRILNVSSGLARFSFPGYAAYAMMKGGIEVFTRFLAQELGPRNIAVNTIAPGAIETDFGGGAVRDNADLNQLIASQTALGRVGLPDDIGGAVASILTDESGWINGQRIEVSGGFHL